MATENKGLIDKIIGNINKYIWNDKDCFKKYIKNNENYDGTIQVSDHNKGVPIRPVCKGDKISPGDNAFRTDIELFYGSQEDKEKKKREKEYNGEVYLVIIEVKGSAKITTNEVAEYSYRARRHKNIYPWLRYGMVWSSPKERDIPRRFYTNNESLDFAFNFNGDVDNNFQDFYENILRKQIIMSLKLHKIHDGGTGTPYFSSNVDFGYKGKEDCREIIGDRGGAGGMI